MAHYLLTHMLHRSTQQLNHRKPITTKTKQNRQKKKNFNHRSPNEPTHMFPRTRTIFFRVWVIVKRSAVYRAVSVARRDAVPLRWRENEWVTGWPRGGRHVAASFHGCARFRRKLLRNGDGGAAVRPIGLSTRFDRPKRQLVPADFDYSFFPERHATRSNVRLQLVHDFGMLNTGILYPVRAHFVGGSSKKSS